MNKENLPKLETAFETKVEKSEFMWDNNKDESPKRDRSFKDKASKLVKKIGQGAKEQSDDAGFRKLLIKTGICAGIAVVILAISVINTPTANNITEGIDSIVNHEFDIDEDIGRLKFVKTLEDSMSVFSPDTENMVVQPYDGEVVTCFGQGGSSGVRISPSSEDVYSIAKGMVTAVGMIDGNGYAKILLDTGEEASFYNMSPDIKVDDIVNPGQKIGVVTGEYLYIELKSDGEYIDPIAFVESGLGLDQK